MRKLLLGCLALAAIAAPTTLATAPANAAPADIWGYQDRVDNAKLVTDVERTTLDAQEAGRIRVRVYGREFIKDDTDVVRIYFDTRRANTGPEFRVTWYLGKNPARPTGTAFVERVNSWNSDGKSVACSEALVASRRADHATWRTWLHDHSHELHGALDPSGGQD